MSRPKRLLAVAVVVGVGAASEEGAKCLYRFRRVARLPMSVVVPDCLAAVECSNCLRRTHSLGLESFLLQILKKLMKNKNSEKEIGSLKHRNSFVLVKGNSTFVSLSVKVLQFHTSKSALV